MLTRSVTKFCGVTERLLEEYPLPCSVDEMRHLFEVGDDLEMICVYPIETDQQVAFFKSHGLDVANDGNWFVECFQE